MNQPGSPGRTPGAAVGSRLGRAPADSANARRGYARGASLLLACALAGCAGVKEKAADVRDSPEAARARQTAPPPVQSTAKAAPPSRKAAPAPRDEAVAGKHTGALSVRSECRSRDESGYTESIKLALERGRVSQLEAKIDMPRRGSCGFRLADFRQTRTDPHVELQSTDGSTCTVRMWQQDSRLTVAFNDCQDKCTRGAFDYVWPVMLNAADGSCL